MLLILGELRRLKAEFSGRVLLLGNKVFRELRYLRAEFSGYVSGAVRIRRTPKDEYRDRRLAWEER